MTQQQQSLFLSKFNSDHQIGLLCAFIGCLLFSLKPILVKLAYQAGGDATSIMALRALSSLPLYLFTLIYLCRKAANRSKIRQSGFAAAGIGILGYYVASYLDISALAFISAQLERLLIFLFPSFVVLISWVVYKQVPTKAAVGATIVGYAGTALILAHDFQTLGSSVTLGAVLAVASAFVFAIYLVASKPLIGHLGSSLFTSIGMGSAGIAILIHLYISGAQVTEWSSELIVIGVILGIVCTVLPSYFVAAGMARLSPTQLSLTNNAGPAITAIFAVLILGELFTIWHGIGLVLVIFSVIMINRSKS
ncbi:DMT family transporter [Vibrio fluminensis]|uniref:DMT family transporter n=1 Tax=Vibrio fluminensis TaxID=2783614 RepID=UPI001887488B|nr:DMT family transporter [Vibrio fluminensis]